MGDSLVRFGRRLVGCALVLLAACGGALEPASTPTVAAPTLGAVRGRVLDSEGRPVPGLELSACVEGREWGDEVSARLRSLGYPAASEPGSDWSVAMTEQDGSFELGGLRAGRYDILARTGVDSASMRRLTRAPVELVDGRTTDVELSFE